MTESLPSTKIEAEAHERAWAYIQAFNDAGITDPQCISDLAWAGEAYLAKRLTPAAAARKPRRPTLVSVAKQASKAAIPIARYEIKPDGTVVVVTGKPDPAEPENPWPLDEFRTKETKQ